LQELTLYCRDFLQIIAKTMPGTLRKLALRRFRRLIRLDGDIGSRRRLRVIEGSTSVQASGGVKSAYELGVSEVADLLGDDRRLPLAQQDFQAGMQPHHLIGRQQLALG
jgi:hypothetical protein